MIFREKDIETLDLKEIETLKREQEILFSHVIGALCSSRVSCPPDSIKWR